MAENKNVGYYFPDRLRVLDARLKEKLLAITEDDWDKCDVVFLQNKPDTLYLKFEGMPSYFPFVNFGMPSNIQKELFAMGRDSLGDIEEDIIKAMLGKVGNVNFCGAPPMNKVDPIPMPEIVKPKPIRVGETPTAGSDAGFVFCPKIGDFSAALPPGLVAELNKAKKLSAIKIEAKILHLQKTLNKVKTTDVFIGSFRLWLKAWACWIVRCTADALTAIYSLIQQAIVVLLKGRTHALVGIRRTMEKVLRSVHDVRLLPPLVDLEGDPSRYTRLKAAVIEKGGNAAVAVLQRVKNAKETTSTFGNRVGTWVGKVLDKTSEGCHSFYKRVVKAFTTPAVLSKDGKELIELSEEMSKKLPWYKRVTNVISKPLLLLRSWWAN